MIRHEFCDHCPGCRPAVIDIRTGQPVPDDEEPMLTINRVWNQETTYAERKAFIDVTSNNSTEPETMRLAQGVVQKFKDAPHKD